MMFDRHNDIAIRLMNQEDVAVRNDGENLTVLCDEKVNYETSTRLYRTLVDENYVIKRAYYHSEEFPIALELRPITETLLEPTEP